MANLYNDADFDSTISTLTLPITGEKIKGIKWLRPKDIVDSGCPKFIIDGWSRMDLHQGMIGDCWFVAAVACIATKRVDDHELLRKVVLPGQSFGDHNAGEFRFNFWTIDGWKRVTVDDKLPTLNKKLIFLHNGTESQTSEFWGALLEKAYAKFRGGYPKIDGGFIQEAFADLTGGITHVTMTDKHSPDMVPLFERMLQVDKTQSIIGCSTPSFGKDEDSGIFGNHVYSITKVAMLKTNSSHNNIKLLRLRNPWGNKEWTGAWSDESDDWKNVSAAAKQRLNFDTDKEDGEFWMEYSDWLEYFDRLTICYMSPDTYTNTVSDNMGKVKWTEKAHRGQWDASCGIGPFESSAADFWRNPQFEVPVNDVDTDGKCTFVISLMMNKQPKVKQSISYDVFKADIRRPIPMDAQAGLVSPIETVTEENVREISGHYRLERGNYVIIPSTSIPKLQTKFLLRVYTETTSASKKNIINY